MPLFRPPPDHAAVRPPRDTFARAHGAVLRRAMEPYGMPSIRPQRAVSHPSDGTERGPLKRRISLRARRAEASPLALCVCGSARSRSTARPQSRAAVPTCASRGGTGVAFEPSTQPPCREPGRASGRRQSEPRARQMRKKSDDTPDHQRKAFASSVLVGALLVVCPCIAMGLGGPSASNRVVQTTGGAAHDGRRGTRRSSMPLRARPGRLLEWPPPKRIAST
jgi:hypothetical protein